MDSYLVGPIPLDEIYRHTRDKDRQGKLMAVGDWPSEDDIIAAFRKTKLWIKDSKRIDSGKIQFQDDPHLLLEGPLYFDLKDKNGKEFMISIKDVQISDMGYGQDGKSREMRILIRLHTSPYKTEFSIGATGLNVFSKHIIWDEKGAVTWVGKNKGIENK